MRKMILKFVLRVRWAWFHISPRYVEFKMTKDSESYFQDMKTNAILCDYEVR